LTLSLFVPPVLALWLADEPDQLMHSSSYEETSWDTAQFQPRAAALPRWGCRGSQALRRAGYSALASPVPPHLAALVEQLKKV